MHLEALSDAVFFVRQTKIGRDAAEGFCQDCDGAAIAIALGVTRPLCRGDAAFYPVRANARQFDPKATVTATRIPPPDLFQREWPSPQNRPRRLHSWSHWSLGLGGESYFGFAPQRR
jgi:hypothetical protein